MLSRGKAYHERKLKEAIEYLYPDDKSRIELARKANNETKIGSCIDCGSEMLLTEVPPVVPYSVQSVLMVLKGVENIVDNGRCSTEKVGTYGAKWK
ncbi:hypothetical protein NVP1089O_28 [Vibrio phage 1.089.O._10N.261.51.F9]|nr:hypothetical protein NVP1012O_28 [Vibrio phage 1.012.O._10N.261.48.C12]AUR86766.1 hypothetical protein NVP1089O_28 [Vibrio phage 1.089.O._10N.261.51.F9]AUR87272.1 hypothetical protein NVP1098O_28 [Vibrio phage 1.098.O._10N.286.51.B9]AUR88788.1 hypothetical protein NVP1118A_28 [Vibrio phage 1.118.A._10N.261.49.F6]AUR88884.1 hypothetical protein NVP1118B_28 [Vibrio phage 1.118.B._10N.261.49.F6]AUR91379.1 hypothetical protein NVP1160O_30 [Vibrio phage 1.160.O._10N.261.48.B11]AUR97087.1 hypoth